MVTEEGIENLISQPVSENPEEDNAIERTISDDVRPELRTGLDKLQINSDDT